MDRDVHVPSEQRVLDLLDEARFVAGSARAIAGGGDLDKLDGASQHRGDHLGLGEREGAAART